MRTTSVLTLIGLTAVAGGALGVWWWRRPADVAHPRLEPALVAAQAQRPVPRVQPGRIITDERTEPGLLSGFPRWDDARRIAVVNGLMAQPDIDLDVKAYLMRVLKDRRYSPYVRNQVANRLCTLPTHDPELATALTAAITDPNETPTWQAYAMQHAMRTVSWHPDPVSLLAVVQAQLTRDGALMAGTALPTLQSVEPQHPELTPLIDAAAARIAFDDHGSLDNRITALGMIGARRLRDQAPAVRRVAASAADPSLVRVAIATLGLIGNAGDLALIEPRVTDGNHAIALAAKAAAQRLRAKPAL